MFVRNTSTKKYSHDKETDNKIGQKVKCPLIVHIYVRKNSTGIRQTQILRRQCIEF
jgi:ribosome assembly protein YihI (activator of Der GTPase)